MLFNSLEFLLFAPAFFVLYFRLSGRTRLMFVVLASYFFYGWWDWRFLSLIIASTCIDYFIGARISRSTDLAYRKKLLYVSLTSNLGILGVFKYFDFFSESLSELMGLLNLSYQPYLIDVILPVGISFYTFQTLSYTIDIYRGRIESEPDLVRFAAYVALFPQLVAGPIVRAAKLLPQLHADHQLRSDNLYRGMEMVIWGFFLKLCLADNAAIVVDTRFDDPGHYGSLAHIIGVFSFSLQIYGDFAGYSLIAIGLGRIMGLDFGVNFNRPYFAISFSDFWQRWHISLSSWLRDYLYISLGGNRGGKLMTFRNLVVTMFLGGLWHGAALTFIVWGLLHGTYLVLQRLVGPVYWKLANMLHVPLNASRMLMLFTTFALTNLAWIYFRAEDIDTANRIIGIIMNFEDLSLKGDNARIQIAKTAVIGTIVILVDLVSMSGRVRGWYHENGWFRIMACSTLIWMIALLGSFSGTNFIYFQF